VVHKLEINMRNILDRTGVWAVALLLLALCFMPEALGQTQAQAKQMQQGKSLLETNNVTSAHGEAKQDRPLLVLHNDMDDPTAPSLGDVARKYRAEKERRSGQPSPRSFRLENYDAPLLLSVPCPVRGGDSVDARSSSRGQSSCATTAS
jgi:hypothetical protein